MLLKALRRVSHRNDARRDVGQIQVKAILHQHAPRALVDYKFGFTSLGIPSLQIQRIERAVWRKAHLGALQAL